MASYYLYNKPTKHKDEFKNKTTYICSCLLMRCIRFSLNATRCSLTSALSSLTREETKPTDGHMCINTK